MRSDVFNVKRGKTRYVEKTKTAFSYWFSSNSSCRESSLRVLLIFFMNLCMPLFIMLTTMF